MRQWLKDARVAKGLTMKQLANELHISESYYCSIENGNRQRDMDLSLAEKIGSSLGIHIKKILNLEADTRRKQSHSAE